MKRLSLCALFLWLAAFSLCKCTRSTEVKAEQHLALQEEGHSEAQEHSTEVVQQGPETITTTVEEFAAPASLSAPGFDGALSLAPPPSNASQLGIGLHVGGSKPSATATDSLPSAPILVKRTVTVDQRGPITDTKAENAKAASGGKRNEQEEADTDETTKTRAGPSPFFWLGIGSGLVLAVGLALKFNLFGKLLALVKGVP